MWMLSCSPLNESQGAIGRPYVSLPQHNELSEANCPAHAELLALESPTPAGGQGLLLQTKSLMARNGSNAFHESCRFTNRMHFSSVWPEHQRVTLCTASHVGWLEIGCIIGIRWADYHCYIYFSFRMIR